MATTGRERRKGARSGSLSRELQDALRTEEARIARLSDPVEVCTAVGDTFAALDTELERLAEVRIAAIRQLRADGWSYDRIAAATGLSKPRVQQLSNLGRDKG
jgi:DNA-directed RNA polymerase specialized sigma24 family protein